jgi:hypothetical protein
MELFEQTNEIQEQGADILSSECLRLIVSAFKMHKANQINLPMSDREIFARAACQHYRTVDPNGLDFQRWKRMTRNCKALLTEEEKVRFKELCRIFRSEKEKEKFPVVSANANAETNGGNTEAGSMQPDTNEKPKPRKILFMPAKTAKWVLGISLVALVIWAGVRMSKNNNNLK